MEFFSFNQLPLDTDDFFYFQPENDTIVVCHPRDALCISPVFLRSRKTLEEHIQHINEAGVKKAAIIAESMEFLVQCPGLEDVWVIPAVTAENFDFSPLYDMPCIKCLACNTMYGMNGEKWSCVDYSRVKGLQCLIISGKSGHRNLGLVRGLKTLYLQYGHPRQKDLVDAFDTSMLESLSLTQSPIRSLHGLEKAQKLRILKLDHNRNLEDISAIELLGDSLQSLIIEGCGRIKDFSALSKLRKLERLYLWGANHLPNLDFLDAMPNLGALKLFMTVDDGQLAKCDRIPWVMIRGKRHYDRRDKDLSKLSVPLNIESYREYDG